MQNLWITISKATKKQPDAVALFDPHCGASYTYRDLVNQVNLLASELQECNCPILGIYADNSPDWLIADLAGLASGCCVVPLPTFFTPSQLQHVVQDVGMTHLLKSKTPDAMHWGESSRQQLDNSPFELLALEPVKKSDRLPPGTIKVTYTSGSTGTPKGVCLSGEHLSTVAHSIAGALQKESIEKHLCVLPLSTLLENVAGNYAPLLRHAQVDLPGLAQLGYSGSSDLQLPKFLASIANSSPGSVILIPELLDALINGAGNGWSVPTQLKFIAVGGARVNQRQLDYALELGLPVFQGYGLSECGSVVSINVPGANKAGSVGKPLSHLRVHIEEGEVVVDGPHYLGYAGQKSPQTQLLRTGDLGFIDAEGYLYVNGRKRNLIISSYGRNISPEWVESELHTIPGLQQCVLFGEARPHCVALIYANKEVDSVELNTAINAVNQTLPDYAQVKKWHRLSQPFSVSDHTLTPNGRLKRELIESRYKHEIDTMYHPPRDDFRQQEGSTTKLTFVE